MTAANTTREREAEILAWLADHEANDKLFRDSPSITRDLAAMLAETRAEVARLRLADVDADAEAARWQRRIAETIRAHGIAPCDASGNESGDPLDWSNDQIWHALDALEVRAEEWALAGLAECERLREAPTVAMLTLARIANGRITDGPFHYGDKAMAAAALTHKVPT